MIELGAEDDFATMTAPGAPSLSVLVELLGAPLEVPAQQPQPVPQLLTRTRTRTPTPKPNPNPSPKS
jgi:hypothetical protein